MIYQKEIEKAIMWLFETQNRESFGWSWVRDISPNEQNTAEVVYATALFSEILSDDQKKLINNAVRKWLLVPSKHAVLTIDWAWVGLALAKYLEHIEEFSPDFGKEFVTKDIENCVNAILALQNADGGWGDYKHDISTAFRTAISIIFLEKQAQVKTDAVESALDSAVKFLLQLQNEDGGFGNVLCSSLTKNVLSFYAGVEQDIVESQYMSSISATGYALWALSCRNRFMYGKEINRAYEYLKGLNLSNDYEIFFEVGIRRGTLFTFRHFGAAWMGIGLLNSGKSKFTSEETVKLIKHFLSLQDRTNGGFKCNDSSEVYTWSNCNALMFFRLVVDALEDLNGLDYTDIIIKHFMK
ncbi:MAG: hypothetical protein J6B29_04655 [Clostridia bacterium]|nr:hypothetical protein [Clostridia bacterium]